MYRIICSILVWLPLTLAGQPNWEHAGVPGKVVNFFCVWANPAHDTIYYGGAVSLDSMPSWFLTNSVLRYANGTWDTLGVFDGQIQSIVQYHDTLFVAGDFGQILGDSLIRMAAYVNGQLHPYGDFNNVIRKLKVLNGDLYALGAFSTVDGDSMKCIAKRVGGSWQSVGDLPADGGLLDAVIYNGGLVACGGVDFPGGRLVGRFDGTDWESLGPGVLGGLSGVRCLEVFGNDLFIGGQISTSSGNPGMNILRWDGTQYNAVGDGIRWQLGSTSFAAVWTMVVHDSVLFVGGGFNYAGGVHANGVAMWDGIEWCGVPGEFLYPGTSGVEAMDFYHDTLFVACGWIADGDSVYKNAKFIGGTYPDTCSGPVGIAEGQYIGSNVKLFPNPARESIVLTGFTGSRTLILFDGSGRVVRSSPVLPDQPVPISNLSPGLYTVRLVGRSNEPDVILRFMRD